MERDNLERKAKARREMLRRSAKEDFWSYCLYMDFPFFRRRLFLKRIAEAYQRLHANYIAGNTYAIAVSLPPRSGKSYISSMFISWMIGNFPEESVMRNCCSDTLYQKLSYDTRDIIKSYKYQTVFADVQLKSDKQNVDGWNVEQAKQVTYFGGGVGGTVIGFGASMLAMTDDLYRSLADAMSSPYNDKVWAWEQGTHESRIERRACRVDIGTRWSKDDVLGRLEESGIYDEIIRIPALDDNNQSFCEDVMTTEQYIDKRERTDEEIWAAEYMQQPIELKGLLFPKSELGFYDPATLTFDEHNYSLFVIDPADEGDDFVGAFGPVIDGALYIDRFICNNDGVEFNVPNSVDMALKYKPSTTRIEGNGGWIQTAKDIRDGIRDRDDSLELYIYKETINKQEKILSQAFYVKKRVFFRSDYDSDPQYRRAMDRLTSYMRNKRDQKDDVPDVLANACKYLRSADLMF